MWHTKISSLLHSLLLFLSSIFHVSLSEVLHSNVVKKDYYQSNWFHSFPHMRLSNGGTVPQPMQVFATLPGGWFMRGAEPQSATEPLLSPFCQVWPPLGYKSFSDASEQTNFFFILYLEIHTFTWVIDSCCCAHQLFIGKSFWPKNQFDFSMLIQNIFQDEDVDSNALRVFKSENILFKCRFLPIFL